MRDRHVRLFHLVLVCIMLITVSLPLKTIEAASYDLQDDWYQPQKPFNPINNEGSNSDIFGRITPQNPGELETFGPPQRPEVQRPSLQQKAQTTTNNRIRSTPQPQQLNFTRTIRYLASLTHSKWQHFLAQQPSVVSTHEAPMLLPVSQNTVYLPFLATGFNEPNQILVTEEQGGQLVSEDGQVRIVVPAGAVKTATIIKYTALDLVAPAYTQAGGPSFEVGATTVQGHTQVSFHKPLDVFIQTSSSDSSIYGRVQASEPWRLLSTPTQARGTANVQIDRPQTVAAFTNSAEECIAAGAGEGAPTDAVQQAFVDACVAFGGPAALGGVGNSTVLLLVGDGFPFQVFPNGTLFRADTFYLIPTDYIARYYFEDGSTGWLGEPLAGTYVEAGPPNTFQDSNYNFAGSPIMYFEHGFIGTSGGSVTAHYPFPVINTVLVEADIQNLETDPEKPPRYEASLTFNAEVVPVPDPENIAGSADVTLHVTSHSWQDQVNISTGDLASFEFPIEATIPATETVEFYLEAQRTSPAGDPLTGYAPCDSYVNQVQFAFTPIQQQFSYSYNCEGGGIGGIGVPPVDNTPPTIHYLDVTPLGGGRVAVVAYVTDNRAVKEVVITVNGQQYIMTSLGGNRYGAVVQGKSSGTNTYIIDATDTSNLTATAGPVSIGVDQSGRFGTTCFGTCGRPGYIVPIGDPIDPQAGNYTDSFTDLFVDGTGDADISIARSYNSLAAVSGNGGTVRVTFDGQEEPQATETVGGPAQYFGRSWTFPYSTRLENVSIPELGVDVMRVFYPDGQSVTFEADGAGYRSTAPQNADRLLVTGDGYELHHQRTLKVDVFDTDGRLIQQRDKNENTVTIIYSDDNITQIENASGRTIEFEYTDDLITKITAPEGKEILYSYEDQNLVSMIDANGNETRYEYNEKNQLTAIITPKGHPKVEMIYDDEGRVTFQQVGISETYDLEFNNDQTQTIITDGLGNTETHTFDEDGRTIRVEDSRTFTEEFDYDKNFYRTYFKDRLGREWHYEYDEYGNKLSETGPLDWQQEWTYNELDLPTSFTDAMGRTTEWEYDERGNLLSITNPVDDQQTIVYDERGLPLSMTDFNGNTTTNTYDATTGDLLSTINAEGDALAFGYDELGRMIELINGIGSEYTYSYDGNDNLLEIAGPLKYVLGYRYDANNNLTHEIDPNSGLTEYVYDESERVTAIIDQLGHTTSFDYDAMNNLIHEEDAEGRVWTYEYDGVYNRVAEHGPEDTHRFFEYDAARNGTRITTCNSPVVGESCAVGYVEAFTYDDLDRITESLVNPGKENDADTNVRTSYSYDLAGNMLSLTDPNSYVSTFEYDDLDRLTREVDAEQQTTLYSYDAMSNLLKVTNPREYETLYTYDGANRVETITAADEGVTTVAYDGNSNLVSMIDPLEIETRFEFDALDRQVAVIENYVDAGAATVDQNVRTGFRYDLAGNLRFVDDPRGLYTTEHRYDAAHRRIQTIDAEGGITALTYDAVGNVIAISDPNQHVVTSDYDGLDRPVTLTNAEEHSVTMTYDRLGNVLSTIDAREHATFYNYDDMQRMIEVLDAEQGMWEYTYDAAGSLLEELDANGHRDTWSYDKVYRLLDYRDAEGYHTSYVYDRNGNPIAVTDGNRHTTIMTYDPVDRLASVTNAESETTSFEYDLGGNQIAIIEADNVVTGYAYDPLYRLASVTLNQRSDAASDHETNVVTQYLYDHVGNRVGIIDANTHETRFAFDGMNRLVQEVDARDNTWDYEYDPAGNRTARIDALRNRTNYSYYPDNQLKSINYFDGTSVAFGYDPNNNRVAMSDHLGKSMWVYDKLNRVTHVVDSLARQLGYSYDAVGNRISLTYNDGRTVNYTYYDNDWLHTVVDPEGYQTSYARDGVGLMTFTQNPNSTTASASYDKANRLVTLVNQQHGGAAKTNSAFHYTYNDVGHRTEMVAEYGWRQPDVVTSNYAYDPIRRLVRDEDSEGLWTTYRYDAVGNRLELNSNDSSLTPRPKDELTMLYTYNEINQLVSAIGNTHPGQGTKRGENVGQALHALRHEISAQAGKHIEINTANQLLADIDTLVADVYATPTPNIRELETRLATLREYILTARSAGLIDSDGIVNSLLVKLDLGVQANNGASGELQTTTFEYDANGNRINKEYPGPQGPRIQGTDYRFDPENRLVEALDYQMNLEGNRVDRAVTRPDYDGVGRRLIKEYDPKIGASGIKRVEYVFDGLDPVAEYNIWNPQYENFYRGDMNRIIEMQHFPSGTDGQMFWYYYDGLNSVVGLTKQHGQSHHNYRYEPFGQIEMPPGNFTGPHNHYTFTGQEIDENTGFYDFFARNYDHEFGVWLTQDTYRGDVRNPRSLHRLGYVENNPTSLIDAYGYWGWNPITSVKDATNWVGDKAEQVGSKVYNGASKAYNFSKDVAKKTYNTTKEIYHTGQDAYNAGKDIVEDLSRIRWDGVVNTDGLEGDWLKLYPIWLFQTKPSDLGRWSIENGMDTVTITSQGYVNDLKNKEHYTKTLSKFKEKYLNINTLCIGDTIDNSFVFTGNGTTTGQYNALEWFLGSYNTKIIVKDIDRLTNKVSIEVIVTNISHWESGTRVPKAWQNQGLPPYLIENGSRSDYFLGGSIQQKFIWSDVIQY